MNRLRLLAVVVLLANIPSATGQEPKPSTSRFPVVAYLPDYRIRSLNAEAAGSVTDLIFFSIEPKTSGDLDARRLTPEALRTLQAVKKQYHNRLLIAVGGWGRSRGFVSMTGDPQKRAHFVECLTRFCQDNNMDGADFDWEHPANTAEEKMYGSLLAEIKKAFTTHGWLVTVALAAWQNLPDDGFRAVDRIHLMAYDNKGRHSTLEQAQAGVKALLDKGVPAKKICLGIPFYGRAVRGKERALPYAEIVRRHHPTSELDEIDGMYFNGVGTVARKTTFALDQGLGGVMIWEVGQDTSDDTSLLKAIRKTISQQKLRAP